MCCLLVSGFLTEMTQQIHSLRASGVISSHFARAIASERRTFRKSAGTLCTAPGETGFFLMDLILLRYAIGLGVPLDEPGRPPLYAKLPQMMVQMFVHQSCPLLWR
jgi:hypothetical protein